MENKTDYVACLKSAVISLLPKYINELLGVSSNVGWHMQTQGCLKVTLKSVKLMEGSQMKYSSEARVFSEWDKKKCHIEQIRKMN